MKFDLTYKIRVGDEVIDSDQALSHIDTYRDRLTPVGGVDGALVLRVDGDEYCGDQYDPIVRLATHWVRKVPWVLGGDTETVAFRNSEHCFAFVPAGESVEVSFFVGTETEIEEYVCEPLIVRLDAFAPQSLALADHVLKLARALDPRVVDSEEDVRDLAVSLEEGRAAWRDYQLHNRR